MEHLEGRVAVVTGAASGIGRALAGRFAQEGMKVVLADIETDPLERAVAEIRATGAEAIAVATDVSDAGQVQALADATLAQFGAVHVLCNNAGVESGARFADIPASTWEWVLGVNLWGVLHGCRVFLPLIRRAGEGHIVNTASLAAFATGLPTFAPYTTSKFAVLAASECLELELLSGAEQIGVSVLCPGVIATNMCEAERNLHAFLREAAGERAPDPACRAGNDGDTSLKVLHQPGLLSSGGRSSPWRRARMQRRWSWTVLRASNSSDTECQSVAAGCGDVSAGPLPMREAAAAGTSSPTAPGLEERQAGSVRIISPGPPRPSVRCGFRPVPRQDSWPPGGDCRLAAPRRTRWS